MRIEHFSVLQIWTFRFGKRNLFFMVFWFWMLSIFCRHCAPRIWKGKMGLYSAKLKKSKNLIRYNLYILILKIILGHLCLTSFVFALQNDCDISYKLSISRSSKNLLTLKIFMRSRSAIHLCQIFHNEYQIIIHKTCPNLF